MPDIGLEICDILRILETKRFCIDGETNGCVQSIKNCLQRGQIVDPEIQNISNIP